MSREQDRIVGNSAALAEALDQVSRLAGIHRPVLIIGTHFATPTAGHLVKDGERYRLDY